MYVLAKSLLNGCDHAVVSSVNSLQATCQKETLLGRHTFINGLYRMWVRRARVQERCGNGSWLVEQHGALRCLDVVLGVHGRHVQQ